MEFDEFLKKALPPLGYAWRPHRRRGVRRKIQQWMRELHVCSFDDYLYFLQESQAEQKVFRQLLLVTVSRFFRNRKYFEYLRDLIFPDLLQQSFHPLRIWSVGAAAGEEAYSIAMIWHHYFVPQYPKRSIRIEATDIDEAIMVRGQQGIYEKSSLKEVPEKWRQAYFRAKGTQFELDPAIKEYVHWQGHDIRTEPPLTQNDLIFCCYNAFTYFTNELQDKVMIKLAQAIVGKGYLILGHKDHFPTAGKNFFDSISKGAKNF